jgi:hypothetical protein
MMGEINISKKSHPKILIVPNIKIWRINEKWRQHDVTMVDAN